MKSTVSRFRTFFCALFALLALCLLPATANAQITYTNTTSGVLDGNCLTRTFAVTQTDPVGDVNLGLIVDHARRSQIQATLTNPGGTARTLINGIGGNLDDLNVLFDDEAAAAISTHTVNDDDSTAAAFQRTFRPAGAFTGFDGVAANGNWVLQVCDLTADGRNLTFLRADLQLSVAPANYADLSLTKTVSNASPANGATITYTLAVSNAAVSPNSATGVTVLDILPAGVTFVSATGTGTYSSGTGIWTVGTLAPGGSATIVITVTVNASSGAVVTNGAEVRTSSVADIDSTPNNGSTTEDDDAFASFTVSGTRVAGTPPTLICPAGSVLFDWATQSWTAGDLDNDLVQAGVGTFNILITPDFPMVIGSPAINTNLTGGTTGPDSSLFLNMNNSARSQVATTVITLPTAVPGLQFRLHDVDYSGTSYTDKVTVTGSFNGSSVIPTLTNGVSNYVAGNIVIGDFGATDTTADGNASITFTAPVDTITVVYGNHTNAPADPGNQWMSVHDITMCRPVATLSVSKISSVLSDGVSASNPKAIPGAVVQYCITVQNNGSGTTTAISASDPLPADTTYVAGSMRSGTTCGGAATVEDDDNSGADESDPFGMSITGTTITGTAASLAPNSTFALVFNTTVD